MAQAASYTDLYDLMMPQLPGCPDALILQQLQMAARTFCQRTEAWKEELGAIDLVADQADYYLTSAFSAEIKRIDKLYIRTSTDVTNGDVGEQQDETDYYFTQPDKLTLEDAIIAGGAVTDGLVVHVIIVPYMKQNTNTLNEASEFLNEWAEGIIGRAMYALMTMQKKKWTNSAMAGEFLRQYYTAVTDAMAEKTLKGTKRQPEFSA